MTADILQRPAATGPVTHALVIGVSAYRHLDGGAAPSALGMQYGMAQLSTAARSASRIAHWLTTAYSNPRAPLQTLRVLLSPVEKEPLAPGIEGTQRADRANVAIALRDFKRDCEANRDNVGIVYVAGHGVQLTKHEAIVLLEDIANPDHLNPLEGAIDVTSCHAGMNHEAGARTQFWFVDACRQQPEIAQRFDGGNMRGAIELSPPIGVTHASPLYLAASTREVAWARIGESTLFAEALLEALSGIGAVGPDRLRSNRWHVTSYSLADQLPRGVAQRVSAAELEPQTVEPGGRMVNVLFHELHAPPNVRLTINLDPAAASTCTSAALLRQGQTPVPLPERTWPLVVDVEAALYALNVTSEAPYRNWQDLISVAPPEAVIDVGVGS